ncbi:MAG: hypothetical protein HYV09_29035 [Deltaproteobacteria bacterium]|nr:hypothetical protein [Deltaproteobacteria bacterium]
MHRSVRVILSLSVAVASFAACSGAPEPQEQLGSSEQELAISGTYYEKPAVDSGTTDTKTADTKTTDTASTDTSVVKSTNTTTVLDPGTVLTPCAPQRYDVTVVGRTCWALAQKTSTGVWSVAPIFNDAPAEIRDTHCALTWLGNAGTCASPSWTALGLSCQEKHSIAIRSAACATNPAACETTATSTVNTGSAVQAPMAEWKCAEDYDGGVPRGGYSGGCDSCGVISGGYLYLTNPYSSSTILTNVTTAGGFTTTTQLAVTVPSESTAAIPVSGYASGPIYIWPKY